VILDALILILSGALIIGGLWLLWCSTAEAWRDYRRAP
jgi:hypothetical protein